MTRVHPPPSQVSAPSWRAFLHPALLCGIALSATLLAFAPQIFSSPFALALGIIFVFFFAGYLLEAVLFPTSRELSLTRLSVLFVFSLATWAIPATTLQLISANWFAFRVVFIALLWVLTIAAIWRTRTQPAPRFARAEIKYELALAALCVVVALVVWNGPRDADDWGYLQFTQKFIGSDPFQIFAASETRYTIRYAFHVWIFLQAYLGQWLNADVVTLLRDGYPVLLSPLALLAFYAWAKTFFGNPKRAFVAVLILLLIFVTSANADGWGRGFFARSAQDKFMVALIVLPLAFSFAWKFLHQGNFANWFAFGVTIVAGLWVHPISLFLGVIALAGFALFNLISRVPFPRKRWLWILAVSLPVILSPLVIRVATREAVFTVNTPDVIANMRLSEGRLLFQPPFYLADPALVSNPLILFSIFIVVIFAARLVREPRIQFLWGATLVPLALLFNPFTARILGEMITPWQLWRVTWLVPSALILTEAFYQIRPMAQEKNFARVAVGLTLTFLAALALSNLNLARVYNNFTQDHALDASTQDMMRALPNYLDAPSNVLLPRDITRFASAFTYRAIVMSNDAQKPEDARGIQIDRFYAPDAPPKFLDAFLDFWKIEFVVVANGTPQEEYLKKNPSARFLYRNEELSLYRLQAE